jgi:hypothetical protein
MNNQKSNEPFVLGQQIADARTHEQARLQTGNMPPSPLPQAEYKPHLGEWELLNPAPSDFDVQIRKTCKQFAALNEADRANFTSAISMDEFYKLIEFARRVAVFALRDNDADLLQDGLTALAMIEAKRTDFRDILWALALLHHTASRIGVDADSLIRDIARIAEPETRDLFTGFAGRNERYKSLKDSWGYLEVETTSGRGFVRWGFKPYAPKTDLLTTAMRIASIIDADSYRTESIELATEPPEVWLRTSEPNPLKQMLAKVCAGAQITARLCADKHAQASSQQFTVFLIEFDSPDSANVLLKLSQSKKPKDYSMLGVVAEQVFCLVIARSFVQGVAAFENGESLNRFQKRIQYAISQTRL